MDGYVNTGDDNGGVHTNSGIPNHAFYVVATTIGGNAWEGAGLIWYDTMQDKSIPPTATFQQFAAGTLRAAQTRFGQTSSQADAVKAAWTAVKVPV
jgi:Zn-dependent metalloprotease